MVQLSAAWMFRELGFEEREADIRRRMFCDLMVGQTIMFGGLPDRADRRQRLERQLELMLAV